MSLTQSGRGKTSVRVYTGISGSLTGKLING